jgi:hypothetical protein
LRGGGAGGEQQRQRGCQARKYFFHRFHIYFPWAKQFPYRIRWTGCLSEARTAPVEKHTFFKGNPLGQTAKFFSIRLFEKGAAIPSGNKRRV